MIDITLGLSSTVWIGIAIVTGVIGFGLINLGLTKSMLKGLKVVCVASVLITTVVLGYWATTPAVIDPADTIPEGQGTFLVSVLDETGYNGANILKMSDYSFKVLCSIDVHGVGTPFFSGGSNVSGWCNLTVTTTRSDTNVNDFYIVSKMSSVPDVSNVTSGMSYPALAKNIDGTYVLNYTNSAAVITVTEIMQPRASLMRADTYVIRMYANANAIAACALQGGYQVVLSASGVPVTIEFIHNTNT